ncbi:MAG: hypothetical protein A2Y21_11640 [Clostridiales bacterium GWC2_40_7]|nr:MAG: hypothetical protein A2Y21_11640 [Clostridiales bacterium GWC2_40_7]
MGAADERDDIFAAYCYCPITNLDNANAAYEWMYNGVNDYCKLMMTGKGKMLLPAYDKGTMTTAHHWRIRHGAVDRDTSLAIPVILAIKLENMGFDVNFALPWSHGHGGDYSIMKFALPEKTKRAKIPN